MKLPKLHAGEEWTGDEADAALVARFRRGARACALFVLLLGVAVLVGWQFGVVALKHVSPELGAMAAGTALGLACAGLSLLLLLPTRPGRKALWTARLLTLPLFGFGGLTLVEYAYGVDLGIDQLLYLDTRGAVQTTHPGRISMIAALQLVLFGIALLLESDARPGQQWARRLALLAAALSLIGLLGFVYGRTALYALPVFNGLALHTAVGMLVLSAGIVSIQPARGLPSLLVSAGAGGALTRRLLPLAVLVPVLLGWLRLEGERAGLYGASVGVDLMTVSMVLCFVWLIWWTARGLDTASRLARQAEAATQRHADETRDLYENAPCGYHSLSATGLVLRMNATELGWLGYTAEEVVGRLRFPDLMTPAGRAVFERDFPRFVADGEISNVELELRRKDGSSLMVSINASAIKDEQGRFLMSRSTVYDITERKRIEEALRASEAAIRELALTDPLTGAANRRRLDEALRAELQRADRHGGRLSAVMTDLDWFKRVNDAHGHAVGDALLQRFARLIRAQCRESDLVARYGGEEFLVLMPETGAEEAAACAERIRASLEQSFEPPMTAPATATFGVAEYRRGESADALVGRADEALYRGKSLGRNRVEVAGELVAS